jgi:hypothetical protein
VGVANHIEKLQCDFLWGGLPEEFKYHLVSKSRVWNLLMFNQGLLEKWLAGEMWSLNLAISGVVGFLMNFLQRIGWIYWIILGRLGKVL